MPHHPEQHFQRLDYAKLELWMNQARLHAPSGMLPTYVPQLAQVDPDRFAVQVQSIHGTIHRYGEIEYAVPLMSAVKPFALLYLLEQCGPAAVFAKVGMQPSDQPYHSVAQLEADQHHPRNPMINSGAIVLADQLPGHDAETRCQNFATWLNHLSGSQWHLDQTMLASVRSRPNSTNQTIGHLLQQAGHLKNLDMALDTYQQICCLAGTMADLAKTGVLLADPQSPISPEHRQIVNALLLTCGLYEDSAKYAVEIGLPMKSSVSGLLLAIVPKQGAIACYSPPIDRSGHSVVGLLLMQNIARTLNLSVFS